MSNPNRKPVKRGFGPLPCPKCGVKGIIALNLDEMFDDEDHELAALQCRECDEQIPLALIHDICESWPRVVAWIDTAPTLTE